MTYLFTVIRFTCQLLSMAIFIRAILSWVSPQPNALTLFLDRFTEPILAPLRRVIPVAGGFDFTPLVAIIVLQLIASLIP